MNKRKKTGGRQKGSLNKVHTPLRQLINDFLVSNWHQIEADFKTIEPKERMLIFEKLLKYSLPSLQAINMDSDSTMQLNTLTNEQLELLIKQILLHSSHEKNQLLKRLLAVSS